MANELDGRRIAFMVANEGMEQIELTEPWHAVTEAGGTPELLAPKAGQAQRPHHQSQPRRPARLLQATA